jgi:hypothetical protein
MVIRVIAKHYAGLRVVADCYPNKCYPHPICGEGFNIPVFCHGTRARRSQLYLARKG